MGKIRTTDPSKHLFELHYFHVLNGSGLFAKTWQEIKKFRSKLVDPFLIPKQRNAPVLIKIFNAR